MTAANRFTAAPSVSTAPLRDERWSTGKAACVLPHAVLLHGNAESNMDTELIALELRRAKPRARKQRMIQEFLPGRVRLV